MVPVLSTVLPATLDTPPIAAHGRQIRRRLASCFGSLLLSALGLLWLLGLLRPGRARGPGRFTWRGLNGLRGGGLRSGRGAARRQGGRRGRRGRRLLGKHRHLDEAAPLLAAPYVEE